MRHWLVITAYKVTKEEKDYMQTFLSWVFYYSTGDKYQTNTWSKKKVASSNVNWRDD